ncbi:MAG: sugar O-acetyltransferase [Ferruginibacter sp.]|nr:sugar O-acetyltransferase [Ferruginibacter sp.]
MMTAKTEYQKMLAGELYDAGDDKLMQLRIKARDWMLAYNQTPYNKHVRSKLLQSFLAKMGANVDIQTPFFADYGCHIKVGDNFFANFNCVFLDCNFITCGDNVFLGPNVQLYAAHHPVIAAERIKGPELASPIIIGDNVWIGGGAIICAGVTIGSNTTIGAGSVVVKDIPANVVAAGNPCKIIKML